jgi:hypothetical protein
VLASPVNMRPIAPHSYLRRRGPCKHTPVCFASELKSNFALLCVCVCKQVKGSLLSLLFDPVNSHLLRHDASGRVFLDHDPAAFGLLLRHLREVRAAAGGGRDERGCIRAQCDVVFCSGQALQQPAQVQPHTSLLLRHQQTRQQRVFPVVCTAAVHSTGYFGSAPVVLPAIPPADAPAFRALNAHLGLGIADDDIAAAVRRGAALAAATATDAPTPYLAAEFDRWGQRASCDRLLLHNPCTQGHTEDDMQQQAWRGQ